MSALAKGWPGFWRMQGTAALLLSLLGSVQAQTNDGVHAAANGAIYAFGVQLDGKVIVGGAFTNLAGQVRSHIGRLNPNGTLDPLFNPSLINSVNALLIQPDGQIVAASTFNIFSGYNLVRMKPDGTADNSFHVTASDAVSCLALQSDGKILLGGAFKIVQGQSRNLLARLNPNGTLDTAFHPIIVGTNAFPYSGMDEVLSIALQPDGNILIGGSFTSINGTGCTNLGRLYSDGTLDSTFVPPRIAYPVQCVTIQPDGKILAGLAGPVEPSFPFFPPGTNFLRRFNTDGSIDMSFSPGFNDQVTCLALQTDGKIIASGQFTRWNGFSARTNVARLNADGTLDTGFNARIGSSSISYRQAVDFITAIQADGKFLVGADMGGATPATNFIERFINTDPATQTLSFDGSTITWLRGGTSPEVWRTTFEVCNNGADWVNVGDGVPVPGGWQIGGLSLPLETPIRARGFLSGGANNGSSWYVETTLNLTQPPQIIANDSGFGVRSNRFSFNVTAIPSQIIVVEASTNLQDWKGIWTNTFYTNTVSFADPATAQFPSRCYRARLQ